MEPRTEKRRAPFAATQSFVTCRDEKRRCVFTEVKTHPTGETLRLCSEAILPHRMVHGNNVRKKRQPSLLMEQAGKAVSVLLRTILDVCQVIDWWNVCAGLVLKYDNIDPSAQGGACVKRDESVAVKGREIRIGSKLRAFVIKLEMTV